MGGGKQPSRATPAPKVKKAKPETDPRDRKVEASKRRAGTILTGQEGVGQALTTILGG